MEFDKSQFEYLCKLIMLGDSVLHSDVENGKYVQPPCPYSCFRLVSPNSIHCREL